MRSLVRYCDRSIQRSARFANSFLAERPCVHLYCAGARDIIAPGDTAIDLRLPCVAFALLFATAAAGAAELFGKVVAVSDGDTLTLLVESGQQVKVRLSGIDAPERRQPYGDRAKEHLAALIHGQAVRVTWSKRDRYGRVVGRVLATECALKGCRYTVDVGLEQIKAGLAWHYKHYEKEQAPHERIRYSELELAARSHRQGLWSDPRPVPPWSYRQRPEVSAPGSDA